MHAAVRLRFWRSCRSRRSEGLEVHCAMKSQAEQKSMLAEWLETPRGNYVLAWERGQFDSAVEDVFGFNAVQIGLPGIDFLRESRIPLKFGAGREAGCALRSEPVQLPLASQSMDLVALPHV